MKISFKVNFNKEQIEHFEDKIELKSLAKKQIIESILKDIDSYIEYEEIERNGVKSISGSFFILHRSQLKHIADMLDATGNLELKRLITREIVEM